LGRRGRGKGEGEEKGEDAGFSAVGKFLLADKLKLTMAVRPYDAIVGKG